MGIQNDNWLRISGKVNIEAPLEMDTEYLITAVLSTYGMDQSSKQDGTHNFTYKSQFTREVFLTKGDQVIRTIDKERKSQRLRKAIFAMGHEYEPFMDYIMRNLDELARGYEAS